MVQTLLNLDSKILLWIQDTFMNKTLTPFIIWVTHLGDNGAIWIILSVALCVSKKTRKIGILSLISLLCSYLVNNLILKNLIARTRPYEIVNGLRLLIERQKDYSFPSGHTASSFAAAIVMYRYLSRKYGILCLLMAFLIGFSRLYVGVHFPTDVLIGMISGTLIAWMVVNISEKTRYGLLRR